MAGPTQDEILGALLSGDRWIASQISFSIPVSGSTWSYSGFPDDPAYHILTAVQGDAFRTAIGAWARLIATPVIETNDLSSQGDIRVAFSDLHGPAAEASLPPGNGVATQPFDGDVWLDNGYLGSVSFSATDPNSSASGWFALIHEIGHSLGLKHPFEGNQILPTPYADNRYTVMAYTFSQASALTFSLDKNSGYVIGGQQLVMAHAPMVYDILAVQSLYGANPNTDAGDDTYTFDPSTPFLTSIYDAGGRDTIDVSAHTRPSVIDLTPGAYSSIDFWPLDQQVAYWKSVFPGHDSEIDSVVSSFGNGLSPYAWTDNLGLAFSTVIENVRGGAGSDTVTGNFADNSLSGGAGDDQISGAAGNDTIDGGAGANFLQGGDGNDLIIGGAGFDRTNGNVGNDTVHGNDGNDWVTGGKDQDVLFGDNGDDILNGNLGNDTEDGGAGNDTVRGGQGDDVLFGGAGDDWMTGDLGNDTLTGGGGADTFRAFDGAGRDVIADFNVAEGDRVQVDPGSTYTVSQSGADTVITFGSGNSTVLSGITLSKLPSAWIFVG